jgi:hypothetical protein
MTPFQERARGLPAIAELWEEEREGSDEVFTLESEIVAVEGDTGVVRLEIAYEATGHLFRDIWIIRLDQQGRCYEFEEWPFWPSQPAVPAE